MNNPVQPKEENVSDRKITFSDVESAEESARKPVPIARTLMVVVTLLLALYGGWYMVQLENRTQKIEPPVLEVNDLGPLMRSHRAPPIQITPIGDAPAHTQDDLAGKIVLLNFWGTWCGPCQIEMPRLDRLYMNCKEDPDIRILSISYPLNEGIPEDVLMTTTQTYAKDQGFTMPFYTDPSLKTARLYNLAEFPTNVIIDANGMVAYQSTGCSDEEWQKMMDVMAKLHQELKETNEVTEMLAPIETASKSDTQPAESTTAEPKATEPATVEAVPDSTPADSKDSADSKNSTATVAVLLVEPVLPTESPAEQATEPAATKPIETESSNTPQ